MTSEEERSSSGAPVYRHAPRERGFEPAIGDPKALEAIDRHIATHIGEVGSVFHEIISDLVHIDLHQVKPTRARPFWTLVTSGMSDKPMDVPAGAEEHRHAEMILSLPEAWPLDERSLKDERNYWPLRWLKVLARLPHEYHTWLGWGHTVPNGDPPEPFAAGTKLCGMIVAPPLLVPSAFRTLVVDDAKTISFWAAIPIYREEMEFKLARGAEALFDRLDRRGVTELLDPGRRNVCAKRFGLF